MFERKDNPNYDKLAGDARDLIAEWTRNDWYEASFEPKAMLEEAPREGL